MTDGIFERNNHYAAYEHIIYAYARAAEVMSTQSETDFEWSIKLFGDRYFYVGIASQLEREYDFIWNYDHNAITFFSNEKDPVIRIGSNTVHRNLPEQKNGDVIHCRFEPQRKKLVLTLVRK